MPTTVRRVAVPGGNRIPFARVGGPYAGVSKRELPGVALDGLVERFGLAGERIGEFVAGAVLKHARDFNLAREAVPRSRLDPRTPAYDVQQTCGTGLETVVLAADKIALGQADCAIAGGADTVSDAPIGLNDDLRKLLLTAPYSPGAARRAAVLLRGLRPRHLIPVIPRNGEPRTGGLPMGEHAAVTARARQWGVTREQQDALAAESHRRLHAAYASGFLDDLVTPLHGLTRDQIPRPDCSPTSPARLKPVFGLDDPAGATMTAGNSTPLSDGAAVDITPVGPDGSTPTSSPHVKPVAAGGDGLLTAPVFAVSRLLERDGLELGTLDRVEIHEAFASQVLATLAKSLRALRTEGDDRRAADAAAGQVATGRTAAGETAARPMANGSAKAAAEQAAVGRPIRGLISICAASGQGVAALLEA